MDISNAPVIENMALIRNEFIVTGRESDITYSNAASLIQLLQGVEINLSVRCFDLKKIGFFVTATCNPMGTCLGHIGLEHFRRLVGDMLEY